MMLFKNFHNFQEKNSYGKKLKLFQIQKVTTNIDSFWQKPSLWMLQIQMEIEENLNFLHLIFFSSWNFCMENIILFHMQKWKQIENRPKN